MHDEIGGPGAGLGVNKIVDGVEGDEGTIVLLLLIQLQLRDLLLEVVDQSEDRL